MESIIIEPCSLSSSLVKVQVVYESEVEIACVSGIESCIVHAHRLPTFVLNLITKQHASALRLASSNGDMSAMEHGSCSATDTESGTTLITEHTAAGVENFQDFEGMKVSLAAMLHMPIGTPVTDVSSTKPHPVHVSEGVMYSQSFPNQQPTPDTWRYWLKHLLPHDAKLGALALLDAPTMRAALWSRWSMSITSTAITSSGQHSALVNTRAPGRYNITVSLGAQLLVQEGLVNSTISTTVVTSNPRDTSSSTAMQRKSDLLPRIRHHSLQLAEATAAPRWPIRYCVKHYEKPQSQCFLQGYNGGERADSSQVDAFWRSAASDVHQSFCNSTVAERTELTATAEQPAHPVLKRRVFDSRRESFTVLTVVQVSPSTSTSATDSQASGCSGEGEDLGSCACTDSSDSRDYGAPIATATTTSTSMRFTEVLPDHCDIDLSTFTYQYEAAPPSSSSISAQGRQHQHQSQRGDSSASTSSIQGSVLELAGLQWTTTDCAVHEHPAPCTTVSTSSVQSLMEWINTYVSLVDATTTSTTSDVRRIARAIEHSERQTHHLPWSAQRCLRTLSFELPSPQPPQSAVVLTYTANKRFIAREYQPVGASYGVQAPPSFLTYGIGGEGAQMLHTPSFLLTTAIPDASMPFNVITLVSTLLAFFLGSFVNAILKSRAGETENVKSEKTVG